MTYVLGITGQIAAGKSAVASIFEDLGATIVCADTIVHELQKAGTEQTRMIAKTFGPQVLMAEGGVDRKKLRDIVTKDAGRLSVLESILHPAVRAEMSARIDKLKEGDTSFVVLEVPLMFENGAHRLCNDVLACLAPEDVRLARAQDRNPQLTKDGFLALQKRQSKEPVLRKRADFILDTSGDMAKVRERVEALFRKIKHKA